MATIREHFLSELQRYNIDLSEVQADTSLINQGLVPTQAYSLEASIPTKRAIKNLIPGLLVVPDITEGGYSVKYDRAAIKQYYGLLCEELGETNKLEAPQPKIRNRSNRW